MARVFLSYASENLALAYDVHGWLVRAGHDVFFAPDTRNGITAGDAWKQRLYRELNRVDAVLCVVTDAYLDSMWCTAEVAAADSRGCLLIPLRAQQDVTHRLIEDQQHTSADPAVAREQVLTRLQLVDSNGRGRWRDGDNPYPGLEPFTADRGTLFFGRSREVRELSARVRTARGLTAVVGPSGCGKSSLVLAGLLPLMAADPAWLVVDPWSPGDDPVYALATALTRTAQRLSLGWALEEVQRRLQAPRGLRVLVDELLIAHGGKRVLLAVDQAEELFGPAVDVKRRDQFAELLATRGPVGVAATVRSEYLDDLGVLLSGPIETYLLGPLAKDMLRAAIEEPARIAGLRLEPELSDRLMADTESGDALPLLAFSLQLLAEGRSRGDTITVAAYDALGGKNDHLGGLHAVLADQADDALVAATGSSGLDQDAVLAGLVRLVSMDATGRWARRPVDPATLSTPMRVAVEVFVDHRLLTAQRLVQFAHEALLTAWPPLAGAIEEHGKALRTARSVEQAAVEWVGAERADGYLWDDERHAETTRALGDSPVQLDPTGREFLAATEFRIQRARRWERVRRTRAFVVLSVLLAVAVAAGVVAAVQASTAQGERDAATMRELIARAEAVRAADPQQALRLVLAAHRLAPSGESAASLARTLTMNSYAATLRGHTSSIFAAAFSPDQHLLASGDGDDHTLRLWDVSDLARPRALGQPITDHTTWVQGAAFTPDGHTLATASRNELILWNVDDPEHPRKLAIIGEYKEEEKITDSMNIAFSPDGKVLVSTHGAAVRLWDVTRPDQPTQIGQTFGDHLNTYSDVAYSPDGRVMALVLDRDEGSVLGLYDATDPRLPRLASKWPAGTHTFTAVAFVPGKAVLATARGQFGDPGDVLLWDVTDPARAVQLGEPLTGHTDGVRDVAVSPDGTKMTTVGLDDTAITWDITVPELPRRIGDPLTDHTNEVHTVAYRGDGAMVTGSADNNLVLWHGGTPVQPVAWDLPRLDYDKEVTGLAFGRDGHTLATASSAGEARLWDLTDPADPLGPATLPSPKGPVSAFAFHSDGALLATGSSRETSDGDKAEEVLLWDVRDPALPRRVGPALLGLENDVVALRFSPDGGSLWTASSNVTLIRWNVADPDHPLMTAEALKGRSDFQPMIAIRPDGAAIASPYGLDKGEVAIRDITDPTDVRLLEQPIKHRASAVLFGPDGTWLVTGGTDVLLWDVSTASQPQQLGSPLGAGTSVVSLALSADGNTLAAGDWDGTVSVWDISDRRRPHRIGAPLTGHERQVYQLALSPDGRLLASGDYLGKVRLWDLSAYAGIRDQVTALACERAGRGFTQEEWIRHVGPTLEFQPTCP